MLFYWLKESSSSLQVKQQMKRGFRRQTAPGTKGFHLLGWESGSGRPHVPESWEQDLISLLPCHSSLEQSTGGSLFVQCFTSEDHKASYHVLHIIHQWGWPWPNHKHHPWPLALLLVYSVLRSTYSLLKVCMIYFFPVFTVCLSQWEKQFFMYFVHRQDCQMSRTEPYTWLALSKYLFNKWVKTPSTTNV
jgi:hypothetical protein